MIIVFTRAKSFDRWVSTKEELYNVSCLCNLCLSLIKRFSKTGKELLIPEFPLKIRLIGLRVTKLKDLKDTGSSSSGIKRVCIIFIE